MLKSIKKWFKNFFTLNKSEQRGIYVLLVFIIILVLVRYAVIPSLPEHTTDENDSVFKRQISHFIQQQKALEDSIKKLKQPKVKRALTPFLFDPNKLTPETGKKLGLSTKQIGVVLNYLNKGGHFYKKEDFKKIYSVSDQEYQVLAPYIRIGSESKKESTHFEQVQINRCDSTDLVTSLNIKPYLASRIIKYRMALGNFYSVNQLKEVFGMNAKTFNKIKPWIKCDSSLVHKTDLNNAPFKELLHHPYLNYDNTLKIVKIRSRLHGYSDLKQIVTDAYVPDSVFNKIRHYLYIRPQKIPNE
ncbi:MAG: helix-hairpin-helix domain-containing protein [Bacteroidales bacterium]|nr:helix-hairpin-helix domain-containing protein [Bacteroidales bacterium]